MGALGSCIRRTIAAPAIAVLYFGCQRAEKPETDTKQQTSEALTQTTSCDFDSAGTNERQSQTAAIAIDLSGSMEATLGERCQTVGTLAAQLFDSLKERYDLDLFVVATGTRAAPQVILDFTHISTQFDIDSDDPLTSLDTIEAQARAVLRARKNQLRNCVVSACNRATAKANSEMLQLAEGTLQHFGVRCRKDPTSCEKVSLFLVSDLADNNIFASNAKTRINNATLGLKSLTVTACGAHQIVATNLTQQQRYATAWKRVFGSALEILPTCPG